MKYQNIRYRVADGIATLTLDRPDRLNAMTVAMVAEIMDALDRIDTDDDVRVAIFTGEGRAYCAGADLEGDGTIFDQSGSTFDMADHADGGGTLSRRILRSSKPIIAALNGAAVGIGLSTTLAMDFRLASSRARLGFVFAQRGLVPDACSSWLLPRLVGMATAAEWVYSGRLFDAGEALAAGLVRSIHEPDDLLAIATEFACKLVERSAPLSVAVSRRLLWGMLDAPLARAHELESRALFLLGGDRDVKEGVRAFIEKRDAVFPLRVTERLPQVLADWGEELTAPSVIRLAPPARS
jgi:enoyl-CoA hydratase/carnithine racemase